jgi:hypothetical protein
MIKACALITDTNAGMRRSGAVLGDRGEEQRAPTLGVSIWRTPMGCLLPSPKPHRAKAKILPRLSPRFPAQEENCCPTGWDTRAAGLFARAAGTPAKTQNFLRVLFRVEFAKTAGRAGGSGRAAKTAGLRRTTNTGRAATTTGRVFDASYGSKLSGTAGVAGGGARADPQSYPSTETKPRFTH